MRRGSTPLGLQELESRRAFAVTPLASALPNNPGQMAVVGNVGVFSASDAAHGTELWRTDGTAKGTVLVKDIDPGEMQSSDLNGNPITVPASSYPSSLIAFNGVVFFQVSDDVGSHLWTTDGTDAGTGVFGDGAWDGARPLGVVGTSLYLADGNNNLVVSDGTPAGTQLVSAAVFDPGKPVVWQGAVYFVAADSGTYERGLWTTDGSPQGTTLVKSFGTSGYPGNLTATSAGLFFSADDGTTGTELWKSDGTEAGTVLLKDIAPGTESYLDFSDPANPITSTRPRSSYPYGLTAVGSLLLFSADDGKTGGELWASDGTAGGTRLVKDLASGTVTSTQQTGVDAAGNPVFGKVTVPKGSFPNGFTPFKGSTVFTTDAGELWKTNGTAAGTTLVKKVAQAPSGGSFESSGGASVLAVLNGALLFASDDGVHGSELWTSDGTAAGTLRLAAVPPPPPTVTGVDVPNAGTYVAGQTLTLTVHFSDPVTVSGKPTLALTIGTKTKPAGYASGAGSADLTFVYTVGKGDLDTDGIAIGKLAGTIRSSVSAKVNAVLALPAVDASAVRVDAVVPEVKSVAVPPGTYAAGAPIALQVTFTEAVRVTGTPQIAVTIGKIVRQATYVSGDGTTTLVFQVVPQAGDSAPKGIVLAKTIVLPAGAGLTDLPGNAAKLALKAAKTSAVKVSG